MKKTYFKVVWLGLDWCAWFVLLLMKKELISKWFGLAWTGLAWLELVCIGLGMKKKLISN